jgi:hypothetical protein
MSTSGKANIRQVGDAEKCQLETTPASRTASLHPFADGAFAALAGRGSSATVEGRVLPPSMLK